jgi:hypothetical protein
MDYPELNLIIGLALAITLGVTVSLQALLNRQEYLPVVKSLLKAMVIFGLIVGGYAFALLFPTLSTLYKSVLVFAILVIAGLAFLAVIWLRRMSLSQLQRGVLLALLIAAIGLNYWLVIVLIRSLLPVFAAVLALNPPPLNLKPHYTTVMALCMNIDLC